MSPSESNARSQETLRAAAAGLSAHLIYQVSARLLSFAIKAVVVRALKPAHFAFVEIRLSLLVAFVLLPSISGFRPVVLRLPSDLRAHALSVFGAFITVILALLLCVIAMLRDPVNGFAILIVGASLVVRAFVEIPIVFARRRQRYQQSSRARGVATVVSGASQTLAVSLITHPSQAPPAGAVGHLSYSIILGILMYQACGKQPFPPLSWSALRHNLMRDDVVMASVATGEGLIKFLLENGEGIVLDVALPTPVKAAYRLAANLGSVFARFFSEALEEQAFNVFHRLAPSFRNETSQDTEEVRTTCLDTLILGLKAALTVSLLFALIGPAYSFALLRLLYGKGWAENTPASALLNWYFVYLVFMAANGVSEAFVTASATTAELKSRAKLATGLSVLYIGGLFFAARFFEASGIVVVNCLNMAARTGYSIWYFSRLTGESVWSLRHAIPHPGVVLTLCIARAMSRKSEACFIGRDGSSITDLTGLKLLERIAMHGFCGVISLVMFLCALFIFDRHFIGKLRALKDRREHAA